MFAPLPRWRPRPWNLLFAWAYFFSRTFTGAYPEVNHCTRISSRWYCQSKQAKNIPSVVHCPLTAVVYVFLNKSFETSCFRFLEWSQSCPTDVDGISSIMFVLQLRSGAPDKSIHWSNYLDCGQCSDFFDCECVEMDFHSFWSPQLWNQRKKSNTSNVYFPEQFIKRENPPWILIVWGLL